MNSKKFDAQMLQMSMCIREAKLNQHYSPYCLNLVSALTILHLNPKLSDPKRIMKIPRTPLNPVDEAGAANGEQGEDRDQSVDDSKFDAMDVDQDQSPDEPQAGAANPAKWKGIRSDIGILTEKQFQTIVTKCIATLGKKSRPLDFESDIDGQFFAGSPVGGDLAMAAGADTPAVSE